MVRHTTKQRLAATLGLMVGLVLWFRGLPSGEIVEVSMIVESPDSGMILPVDMDLDFTLRFMGGEVVEVQCASSDSVPVSGNAAVVRLKSPSLKGLWVVRCEALSQTGSRHVFKPAFLVTNLIPGKEELADLLKGPGPAAGVGVLVLPQAFFRPGCSNFLPIMEEALNAQVIPQIEKAFGSGRRVLVDRNYMGLFDALVKFWDFKMGRVELEMGTSAPNGLVVEVRMNQLSASGHARFEIAALKRLPESLRKFTDMNFDGRLSGVGKINAVFDLAIDENGRIRTSLRPGSFEARFHHFCFDTLCFEVESRANVQQMITRRLRAMFGKGTTAQLELVLNQSMARAELRFPIFDEIERAVLLPRSFSIQKNQALAFRWDLAFDEPSDEDLSVLYWAGELPEWQSPKPHLLVSDRLVNRVLARIWSKKLKDSLPSEWLNSINKGLASSGYQVEEMTLGLPPVLAPGFSEDGLRLILGDLRVRLRAAGAPGRLLRVHAELPVRLIPSADQTGIALVGSYHSTDLNDPHADRARDDGVVYVECLETEGLQGSGSCSSHTRRFQKLVDLALSMAQSLRAQIRIPVTGPRVPGPGGRSQKLSFSRIQLVPGAPGWLVLEADY